MYRLKRFGPKVSTPFEYRFESDGDLDITVAGKTYDIDSPYDIDSSKTAKKEEKKQHEDIYKGETQVRDSTGCYKMLIFPISSLEKSI